MIDHFGGWETYLASGYLHEERQYQGNEVHSIFPSFHLSIFLFLTFSCSNATCDGRTLEYWSSTKYSGMTIDKRYGDTPFFCSFSLLASLDHLTLAYTGIGSIKSNDKPSISSSFTSYSRHYGFTNNASPWRQDRRRYVIVSVQQSWKFQVRATRNNLNGFSSGIVFSVKPMLGF